MIPVISYSYNDFIRVSPLKSKSSFYDYRMDVWNTFALFVKITKSFIIFVTSIYQTAHPRIRALSSTFHECFTVVDIELISDPRFASSARIISKTKYETVNGPTRANNKQTSSWRSEALAAPVLDSPPISKYLATTPKRESDTRERCRPVREHLSR